MRGLLGGTFDPIHNGHLNLALAFQEHFPGSKVLICPTAVNPLKAAKQTQSAPAKDRLKMVQYAVGRLPGFSIIDYELKGDRPAYTIDTLEALAQASDEPLYLIIGSDIIPEFHQWHRYRDILKLARLFVGLRKGAAIPASQDPLVNQAVSEGVFPVRVLEISATEIRDRVQKGLYCRHLAPDPVIDYIEAHNLYRQGN
jgi:nicotinate-nucleotide adenylyltransferase